MPVSDAPFGGQGLDQGCDCHVHVFDPARYPFAEDRSYTPGHAGIDQLRVFLDGLDLERVVLVQPSVYGSDNRCLLDAMAVLGTERARGVAVVDAERCDAATIQMLRESGVRGLRINLEAKAEKREAALAEAIARTEPHAAAGGMFIQIYADLQTIEGVSGALSKLSVPLVLDHFAGAKAARGPDQPGLATLRRLMETGRTWVKLSAPYRASDEETFDDLDELASNLISARPDRVLWASDWPHTGGGNARLRRPAHEVEPFRVVDDAEVLGRLGRWAGSEAVRRRILISNAAELFGF